METKNVRNSLDTYGTVRHALVMLTQVAVNRATGEGRYEDVIDVAEYLGESVYGSASNALVAMCRQSHLFQETKRKLDAERKPEPASSGK